MLFAPILPLRARSRFPTPSHFDYHGLGVPQQFLYHGQGHVDARGDAARGPHSAILHITDIPHYLDLGIQFRQAIEGAVMRSRPLPG